MIILTGASASGKTVTALELQKSYNLVKAITTTTREKRIGETDGIEYFFISKEEFKRRLENGLFVEYSIYNENYYGCGKDQVADNKIVVLDPNGLHAFKKLNDKRIVTFLLIANEETRKQRMIERGDKPENILIRLKNDVNDFSLEKIGDVDFVIHNENKSIEEIANEVFTLYKTKLEE